MSIRVFYSWQSDSPIDTNKEFIRGAIEDAIDSLNADLELLLAERLELDRDTMGSPGSVDVFATILTKIETCQIFVADVSLITPPKSERPHINSNVAIEIGYALRAVSSERVVMVLNSANGGPEKLPFNLRHKATKAIYNLTSPSQSHTRATTKRELVTAIKLELQTILKSSTSSRNNPSLEFDENVPSTDDATYFEPGEVLGRGHAFLTALGPTITLANGPRLFLRMHPRTKISPLTPGKALELLRSSGLAPFGRVNGYGYTHNRFGAIAHDSVSLDQPIPIESITQLFRNGELWGIDTALFHGRLAGNRSESQKVVSPKSVLDILSTFFPAYVTFLVEKLGASYPLVAKCGITNIGDYFLLDPYGFNRTIGQFYVSKVVDEIVVDSPRQNVRALLQPFNKKLWEECGGVLPNASE